jgi:hypothetical protein
MQNVSWRSIASDDRERPDTPEAEAVRRALREERNRCNAVLTHPAVFRNREI